MNLNVKEQGLLKDLQNAEKLCTEKYQKAAGEACDPQLRDLFTHIASQEQSHYDAVTQMLNGQMPPLRNTTPPQQKTPQQLQSQADAMGKQADAFLLNDLLAIEKYASGAYNTSVFEFCDENARQVLSGIQRQEQEHGKQLSDYMLANGMYC